MTLKATHIHVVGILTLISAPDMSARGSVNGFAGSIWIEIEIEPMYIDLQCKRAITETCGKEYGWEGNKVEDDI